MRARYALLLLPLSVSCVSLSAARNIQLATENVDTARRDDADKYAKYEVTKAGLYLDEARVRNGHGDFEVADKYATTAAELGQTAAQLARQRKDLERRRGKPAAEEAPAAVDPTAPVIIPGLPIENAPVRERPVFTPPPVDGSGKPKLLPPGMGGGQ